jgi:hypothetical protein
MSPFIKRATLLMDTLEIPKLTINFTIVWMGMSMKTQVKHVISLLILVVMFKMTAKVTYALETLAMLTVLLEKLLKPLTTTRNASSIPVSKKM